MIYKVLSVSGIQRSDSVIYVYVCMLMYIYIYIYIYTHTYILFRFFPIIDIIVLCATGDL